MTDFALARGGIFCKGCASEMDVRRKTAIRKCHPKLRTGITVDNLLPHLHIDARGFLTDVEYATITESSGNNVKQVDQLVDVLLKKEDKDFDYFCAILEKEGYNACSKALKEALRSSGKRILRRSVKYLPPPPPPLVDGD